MGMKKPKTYHVDVVGYIEGDIAKSYTVEAGTEKAARKKAIQYLEKEYYRERFGEFETSIDGVREWHEEVP